MIQLYIYVLREVIMHIFLILLLLTLVFTDWKRGKIPNVLIIIGSMAGVFLTKDLIAGISQALLVLILFFPFYLFRAFGAGDVKCIAMVGLYLQPEIFQKAILYTFLVAAAISCTKIIYIKFRSKEKISLHNITIHFAFPIFVGVFLSIGGIYL